ncbi:hypothetical protein [Quadrisphaera sp. INWT6]|uniref:hypothetical protein n=1 Tax=Quadrisphaera sp. INWT6 TaxID=2596917 RepID=UPI0018927FB0|nr:hypothetical protein [Quadrisphaera sp. INWT6]MBF5082699.1 hypothetical protein [Quadrisphaera sp. INWT6]
MKTRVVLAGMAIAVVGLSALYYVTHTGGEIKLKHGVTAFTNPLSFAGGSAALPAGGELVVSDGGCLAIKNESGTFFLGLPAGSRADASGRAVIVGRDPQTGQNLTYAVGDVLEGGGGQGGPGDFHQVRDQWSDAPAACLNSLTGYLSITSVTTP